jgi:hypothetical protein
MMTKSGLSCLKLCSRNTYKSPDEAFSFAAFSFAAFSLNQLFVGAGSFPSFIMGASRIVNSKRVIKCLRGQC